MRKYLLLALMIISIMIGQSSDMLQAEQEMLQAKIAEQSITVPQMFNYQGKLVDAEGKPVNDGSYVMIFRLYGDTAQVSFWSETQIITTNGGLFSTFLGSISPIDIIIPDNCYLGIQVLPSQAEMRPYQKFASVPYAYFSDNADKVGGMNLSGLDTRFVNTAESASISSKMIKDSAVTTIKIADTNVTMSKIQRFGAINGQVLKWTNCGWAPKTDSATGAPIGPAGGDLLGYYPNPVINYYSVTTGKIADTNVTMAKIQRYGATNGQVLKWTNNGWAPMTDSATGAPIGPAGGDLTGDYPNPLINNNAVTAGKIADTNVTMSKIQRYGATTGQVLKWTDNGWAPMTDSATGAPIGPAGGDLTGDYPNPIIADSSITGVKIKDGTIGSIDIRDTTIATADIKDGAVINNKIGDEQVTSDKIFNNTITRADVALNFRAPFADTADYVRNTYIDSARVAVNSYNARKLQGKDTTAFSAKFVDEGQVDAITNLMIISSAVTSDKIQSSAVTSDKIQNSAVTQEKILDNTITNADISKAYMLIDTLLVGTGQIAVGDSQVNVINRNVKNNSLIFLTMGPVEDSITTYIKVRRILTDSLFTVSTRSNKRTFMPIPFSYFIINKR